MKKPLLLFLLLLLRACTPAFAQELHGNAAYKGTLDFSAVTNKATAIGQLNPGTLTTVDWSHVTLTLGGLGSTVIPFSALSSVPTTLAGYGITDGQPHSTALDKVTTNQSGGVNLNLETWTFASIGGTPLNADNMTSGTLGHLWGGAGGVSGIMKSTSGIVSAASAGTDYLSPAGVGVSYFPSKVIGSYPASGAGTADFAGQFIASSDGISWSVARSTSDVMNAEVCQNALMYFQQLTANGLLTAGAGLNVSGASTLTGDVTLTGNLSANSTSATHTLRVSGPTYIDNAASLHNESFTLGSPVTVSSINTGTDTLTATAHGLSNGNVVQIFTTSGLPAPLANSTDYFVTGATTNTLQLAATEGGSAIDITSAGSGTITLKTITRGYSALTFFRDNDAVPGCAALGVNRHGFGIYDNAFFIATNPTGASAGTDHPVNIVIAQHEGSGLQQHGRILLDGTNHLTTLYGWDETNTSALANPGLTTLKGGQVITPGATTLTGAGGALGAQLEVVGNVYISNGRLDVGNEFTASYFSINGGLIYNYCPVIFSPGGTPASPAEGMVYASNSDHHLYEYNGALWKRCDGSLAVYTVSTLPTGHTGDQAAVSDATGPTFLGTLTGGGSVFTPVVYNGSAWVAH